MQLNAYLSYITYNQAMEVVTGAEDAVESPGRGVAIRPSLVFGTGTYMGNMLIV